MYVDSYSEEITKKLSKLKKKDLKIYEIVRKKMDWILDNPEHRFKHLHYDLKGSCRLWIGKLRIIFSYDC